LFQLLSLSLLFSFLYLDCFINKLENLRKARGLPHPIFIGLAFDEQIIEEVPTEAHDRLGFSYIKK
jgi:5-formyltetrahydrofolate cyclo-ligase